MNATRYILALAAVAVTALVFGWMAPAMVSARDTPTVAAGAVVALALYPAGIAAWWRAWQGSANKPKEKKHAS